MIYKAVICDIDGTLVPVGQHSGGPSPLVQAAIRACEERGVSFCLASGRPYGLLEHLVEDLNLTSPIICDNGAAIVDPVTKKSLHDVWIDPKTMVATMQEIELHTQDYHVSTPMGNLDKDSMPQNFVIQARKIVAHHFDELVADEVRKRLINQYPRLHIDKTSAKGGVQSLVDLYITDVAASKQHAVIILGKHLYIDPQEMIAIGDHYNDFPLLMACGLKVAMGNAVGDLKDIADYIAPSVDGDGVAEVTQKYILT